MGGTHSGEKIDFCNPFAAMLAGRCFTGRRLSREFLSDHARQPCVARVYRAANRSDDYLEGMTTGSIGVRSSRCIVTPRSQSAVAVLHTKIRKIREKGFTLAPRGGMLSRIAQMKWHPASFARQFQSLCQALTLDQVTES